MSSGNWIRLYSKQTAESKIAISVGYLKKQGLLQADKRGSLSWSFGGVPNASVGYWVKAESEVLEGDWILLKWVEKLLDKITVHSNKQR